MANIDRLLGGYADEKAMRPWSRNRFNRLARRMIEVTYAAAPEIFEYNSAHAFFVPKNEEHPVKQLRVTASHIGSEHYSWQRVIAPPKDAPRLWGSVVGSSTDALNQWMGQQIELNPHGSVIVRTRYYHQAEPEDRPAGALLGRIGRNEVNELQPLVKDEIIEITRLIASQAFELDRIDTNSIVHG